MGDNKNGGTGTPASGSLKDFLADAFGPGLFLVVLPSFALFFGVVWLAKKPEVGLPVVAIFGIVILLGALALISTLFSRLRLDNKAEALALPPGSVRAFIALALIVLFALFAVMLFEAMGENIQVEVDESTKAAIAKEPANHISAILPHPCATPGPTSKETANTQPCYTIYLQKSRGQESENLSKQLLILIGTLMTSVVSYYFASRSGETNAKTIVSALKPVPPAPAPAPAPASPLPTPLASAGNPAAPLADASLPAGPSAETTAGVSEPDGCSVPIENPTADKDLPMSQGGVAK